MHREQSYFIPLALVLCAPLLEAAEPRPACPQSPVIKSIEWAPADSIVRQAKDGDNWPVTWGADDALYTTWGDGTDFVPKVERKLSCGFARVERGPDDFPAKWISDDGRTLHLVFSGDDAFSVRRASVQLFE